LLIRSFIPNSQPIELTCPPRIVGKGTSIWLKDDEKKQLYDDRRSKRSATVYRKGTNYYLIQTRSKNRTEEEQYDGSILLNGYPIYEKQCLKDGDFMLFGKAPAIFQADPIADKQKYSKTVTKKEELLIIPNYLKKAITVDASGITFHAAHVHIKWWEIEFVCIEQVSYRARFTVSTSLKNKEFRLLLKAKDLAIFVDLLVSYVPIDLSVLFLDPSIASLQDGYEVVAQYKIIDPANAGARTLPASRDQILGLPDEESQQRAAQAKKRLYVGLVIIIVLIALMDIRFFAAIIFVTLLRWSLTRLLPFTN
jgi:hypothetical protein